MRILFIICFLFISGCASHLTAPQQINTLVVPESLMIPPAELKSLK